MDHRSSSYVMWSGKRSGIEQLRSGPCPSFGSAAYTYPSDEASCEEQAFAEDTLMFMHVWPPRSYSCTFCHKEFRSAQALGGHMNVHRRDRARLRQQQQPSSPDSLAPGDREIRNPNTPPSEDQAASNRSPDNCNYVPSSLSAANDRQPKDQRSAARNEVQSLPKDFSQSIRDQSLLKRKDHFHSEVDELEDQAMSTKRRCVAPSEFPLFFSSNSQIEMQRHLRNKVAIKSTAGCPNDELDLELRLGNCPKVMS